MCISYYTTKRIDNIVFLWKVRALFEYQERKKRLVKCCVSKRVPSTCANEYCKPSPNNTTYNSRSLNHLMNEIANSKIMKHKKCASYSEEIKQCLTSKTRVIIEPGKFKWNFISSKSVIKIFYIYYDNINNLLMFYMSVFWNVQESGSYSNRE